MLIQYKNERKINRSKAESLKNLIGKSKGDFKDDNISKEFCISVASKLILILNNVDLKKVTNLRNDLIKNSEVYIKDIVKIFKKCEPFSSRLINKDKDIKLFEIALILYLNEYKLEWR